MRMISGSKKGPETTRRYRAILSLGSNVGDRADRLDRARVLLESTGDTEILRCSRVLENRALLFEDQPDFLNQLLVVRTGLTPEELLNRAKEIEEILGRKERFRYGPREIDVDILIYEKERRENPELTLPHPGLKDRPYLHLLMEELGEPLPDFPDQKN